MATSVQQEADTGSPPRPEVVGNAFVQQYYHFLHQSPEHVFRFYQDVSKLGRPDNNGILDTVSTMQAINEKILALGYGECSAEIKTVDAQDSHLGGVVVLVTGHLTGKDNVKRNFTQTFFLAPQDPGYFVLNDIFRYVDESDLPKDEIFEPEVQAPLIPQQETLPIHENNVIEEITAQPEEAMKDEPQKPQDDEVLQPKVEVVEPEVVDEVQVDSQSVTEPNSKIDEAPKKSYASIVKVMRATGTPMSNTVAPRPVPKNPDSQVTVAPPVTVTDTTMVNANPIENGNAHEGEGEGYSIYVKGLPMTATPAQLESEFKRFGPIKHNGIQVRSSKGFCFGFVEFEVPNAVQSALEASPVLIGGRHAAVEEKRSTNSRVNRPRFMGMRGGYRGDGRGRGNYVGGRGYGRVDYNRVDFPGRGNGRGGYPNRIDGYQRADQAGNNGGRLPRPGGMAVNGRGMPPRVQASA